jgi:hypothetical protein
MLCKISTIIKRLRETSTCEVVPPPPAAAHPPRPRCRPRPHSPRILPNLSAAHVLLVSSSSSAPRSPPLSSSHPSRPRCHPKPALPSLCRRLSRLSRRRLHTHPTPVACLPVAPASSTSMPACSCPSGSFSRASAPVGPPIPKRFPTI